MDAEDESESLLPRADARRWARTGMLAAFALVLSYAETFMPLPIPVPGAKLGLANVAVLLALDTVGWCSALTVACIKMLVTGLLFGSPIMLPYSAAGTLLSFAAMAAMVRIPLMSDVTVSVFGAAFHIIGQLAVASIMLGTDLVWYSFPLLLAVAFVTGFLTGKAVGYLRQGLSYDRAGEIRHLPKEAEMLASGPNNADDAFALLPGLTGGNGKAPLGSVPLRWLMAAMTAYGTAVLLLKDPAALLVSLAVACAAAATARIRPKAALGMVIPLISISIITMVAQVAYVHEGAVLVAFGPLTVTEGALRATSLLILRLLCLVIAGTAVMAVVDGRELLGALRKILDRCGKFGLPAERLALAADLAVSFLPTLTGQFDHLRRDRAAADPSFGSGKPLARLRDYCSLLQPLAAEAFAYADAIADSMALERPQGNRRATLHPKEASPSSAQGIEPLLGAD